MSVMAEISKAIRLTLAPYGENLSTLPDEVLADAAEMIAAFNLDLRAEIARRRSAGVRYGAESTSLLGDTDGGA